MVNAELLRFISRKYTTKRLMEIDFWTTDGWRNKLLTEAACGGTRYTIEEKELPEGVCMVDAIMYFKDLGYRVLAKRDNSSLTLQWND